LSHPLTRSQFILGKILGLGIVVLVADLALGLLQSLISMGLGWTFEPFLAVILMGFLFQALVLISITVFLGTFMRPNISVAITIGIFIIGRTIDSLPKFVEKSESEAFKIFVTVVKYVFPNFNRWNWKSQIGLGESVIPNQIGLDSLYFLAWMLVLLSSTIIIFRRKELV
jgi:ABC-type transport system involved in multi-copper enzyme maturation permease subunit